MSVPSHAVFISYRSRDSIHAVDRLDERLKRAFGDAAVFRDVHSIHKWHNFPASIRSTRALRLARVFASPARFCDFVSKGKLH